MRLFYDKDGQPIELDDWLKLHGDEDYCVIGRDEIGEGLGSVVVSTVWLGEGGYRQFETMVFWISTGLNGDLPVTRYQTLEEARAGHAAMVAQERARDR